MDQRLMEHYETKYAAELTDTTGGRIFPVVPYPEGRFAGAVADLAPRVVGKDVLELAAGDGSVALSLAALPGGFRSYTLTEMSEARINGMQRTMTDARFRFAIADASQPSKDLPVASFDAIVSMSLIEHLIDPIGAMSDTRKLLRPGGFVYVETPNIAKWTRRLKLLRGQFPSTASNAEGLITRDGNPVDLLDDGHLHYFTFESMRRMLTERCGYSRVERLPHNPDSTIPGRIGTVLAHRNPTLFSDVVVAAYA